MKTLIAALFLSIPTMAHEIEVKITNNLFQPVKLGHFISIPYKDLCEDGFCTHYRDEFQTTCKVDEDSNMKCSLDSSALDDPHSTGPAPLMIINAKTKKNIVELIPCQTEGRNDLFYPPLDSKPIDTSEGPMGKCYQSLPIEVTIGAKQGPL